MAIDVDTKDCTALSDAELEEMADLAGDEPVLFDIGVLSKERDSWVLITTARSGASLQGFAFCTLERIGGTPSVLVGLGAIKTTSRRDTVLRALMGDMLRRAVLAFPDEDVLIGFRMGRPDSFEALQALHDVRPSSSERASGEDRAWGRRLVKRYGLDGKYDDRAFTLAGAGTRVPVFDHESLKPEKLNGVVELFDGVEAANGDCVISFGWAMAEDLAKLAE
ncbi:MAG: hypothetical protein AAGA99_06495 [Actinomycetota bacterium]